MVTETMKVYPEPQTEVVALQGRSEEIDLRELIMSLRRRKLMVFTLTTLLTLLAFIVVREVPPTYTAESLVLIETGRTQVLDIEKVVSGIPVNAATVESEVEVLQSRTFASKVVDRLNLINEPELNPAARQAGKVYDFDLKDRATNWLRSVLPEGLAGLIGGKVEPTVITNGQGESERSHVIDAFLDRLDVQPRGQSLVLAIRYNSHIPEMAARIANTVADLYVSSQLDIKFEETQRANAWLRERVDELRQQVAEGDQKVASYRKKSGLIEGKGSYVTSQQLSELNTQLVLARTKRAETEARYAQAKSLLGKPGGLESAPEVLSSTLIQRLREQEVETVRKMSQLATNYGDKHPKMINVRADLADLRAKIQEELKKIVSGMENEVKVAKARERALQSSVRKLETKAADISQSEVRLRELQREADATRTLFQTFLARYKETTAQEDLQQPDARVVSHSFTPEKPTSPNIPQVVAAAFVASLLGVVLLVLYIERPSRCFRTTEQIERATGMYALSLVPKLPRLPSRRREDFLVKNPKSAFAEAIRTLCTAHLMARSNRPVKTVMFTSSIHNEGKTTTSLSLARYAARVGHKTLLIDCDLRRPSLFKAIPGTDKSGLVEILTGEKEFADCMRIDEPTGLHFLPAGGEVFNPAELLNSPGMREFLEAQSAEYDLVVLDSPPVLAVSDARLLAPIVDEIIFVVQWERTRRDIAMAGLRQITETEGHIGGIVLTQVDVKKHGLYGYADAGYYYQAYVR